MTNSGKVKKSFKDAGKDRQSSAAVRKHTKKKSRPGPSSRVSSRRPHARHSRFPAQRTAADITARSAGKGRRKGRSLKKAISVFSAEIDDDEIEDDGIFADSEASYTADLRNARSTSITSDSESSIRTSPHNDVLSSVDDRDSLLDELEKQPIGDLPNGDTTNDGPRRSRRQSRNPRNYLEDYTFGETFGQDDYTPYTRASTPERSLPASIGLRIQSKGSDVSNTSCPTQSAACMGGYCDDEELHFPAKRCKTGKGSNSGASNATMQMPDQARVLRPTPGPVTPPSTVDHRLPSSVATGKLDKIKARLEELRMEVIKLERAKLLRDGAGSDGRLHDA